MLGVSFRSTFVEVFESTFGQFGAFVSAPNRSKSSAVAVLLSLAAVVRLQRVIEKAGAFKEDSKHPEYILVGLMSHISSVNVSGRP